MPLTSSAAIVLLQVCNSKWNFSKKPICCHSIVYKGYKTVLDGILSLLWHGSDLLSLYTSSRSWVILSSCGVSNNESWCLSSRKLTANRTLLCLSHLEERFWPDILHMYIFCVLLLHAHVGSIVAQVLSIQNFYPKWGDFLTFACSYL